MATFYILPARPLVGRRFADLLSALFPGLDWTAADGPDLAETLAATAQGRPGVYVVFREDVPVGVELEDALAQAFGAEPGDDVVEVAIGPQLAETQVRHWPIGDGARAA